jgi:outer membrane receptor protein involved in Fe transport
MNNPTAAFSSARMKLVPRLCATLLVVLACSLHAAAFQNAAPPRARVEGVVTDQAGAPVAGAEVTLKAGALTVTSVTDGEGRFAFDPAPPPAATLTVRAAGFETLERRLGEQGDEGADLRLILSPARLTDQVTVTAARAETRISDTAASVVVLSNEELRVTSALTLDDALRQVPGFSLFRRSGSRTANPTTQGVSLRGVGASGASRAVVLADGIPLNDPFGGWVYWGRVPRESIGRIEVVRGGASDLYGTDALGGVINFIPRRVDDSLLALETSYGSQQTPSGSIFAGGRVGQMGAQLAAEAFHTDGYVIVDERERGSVDTPAGATHTTLDLTLDRLISDYGRVFLRGSVFGESRENGTPLQQNRTHIRQVAMGGDLQSRRAGALSARIYAGSQTFDQDFSAVAAGRESESLTRSQRVPAQQLGLSAQWSRSLGSRQTLVAGLDAREVRGASDELVFVAGRLSSAVGAGGRERTVGLFGQDIIRITPRWLVTVGARVDRWRNYRAHATTLSFTQPGRVTVTEFDDRTETAFSPRLSLVHRLTDRASLTASAYRAFRAPTLNELYRTFRVGNAVTLANEQLRAERLTGGEAGASFAAFDRRLNVRGIFFWGEITRPVANVTLNFTPELITRQRQNLGRTRSRGVEVEADAPITSRFGLSAGYQYVQATVLEFPANVALEGLLVPQVPRHQFTFQARYSDPSQLLLGLQGRAVGVQFDDDQNRFELGRFFTLDALASRPLTSSVEIFAAAENLLNQRYDVGRTPIRTIGPPLLVRLGLRLRFGAR